MNNTQAYAKKELQILENTVKDAIIIPFKNEILALAERFGNSGQSGGSAPYVADVLSQAIKSLCLQEPIWAIYGTDDEWVNVSSYSNVSEQDLYQNKRCYALFLQGETAKYNDAIVFNGDVGGSFTGGDIKLKNGNTISSSQKIKGFPFYPKTFYIDVIVTRWLDKDEKVKDPTGDWWTYEIKDESQLDGVRKHYDCSF